MINHTSISKDTSDFVNNLLFLLSEALEQGGFNSDNQQYYIIINTTSLIYGHALTSTVALEVVSSSKS